MEGRHDNRFHMICNVPLAFFFRAPVSSGGRWGAPDRDTMSPHVQANVVLVGTGRRLAIGRTSGDASRPAGSLSRNISRDRRVACTTGPVHGSSEASSSPSDAEEDRDESGLGLNDLAAAARSPAQPGLLRCLCRAAGCPSTRCALAP